jgi:hypothetical protein
VKIDAHATQEQLLKLSEQVLRRDLLVWDSVLWELEHFEFE